MKDTDEAWALPSVSMLLQELEPPAPESRVDRFERRVFAFMASAGVAGLLFLGVASAMTSKSQALGFAAAVCFLAVVSSFVLWGLINIVSAFLTLRDRTRIQAERTDRRVALGRQLLLRLREYPQSEMREFSDLLMLEAKRIKHRAGLISGLAAVGSVAISFLDVADRVNVVPGTSAMPLFVYAGSLALLMSGGISASFAGRLEKLAGLTSLSAAERD